MIATFSQQANCPLLGHCIIIQLHVTIALLTFVKINNSKPIYISFYLSKSYIKVFYCFQGTSFLPKLREIFHWWIYCGTSGRKLAENVTNSIPNRYITVSSFEITSLHFCPIFAFSEKSNYTICDLIIREKNHWAIPFKQKNIDLIYRSVVSQDVYKVNTNTNR